MNIDWNAIRPLNGGRDKGFEELCAQLARAEKPAGSRFERKGTPDAGVECYTILPDTSEWGWQSKYFDGLGDPQWSQIDESVDKALEKHPRLVRYFVCVPFDLPDGRIKGRKSAKERWDDHVKKWTKWASKRKMTVEFVYWGSHEMLERLAQPHNVGRVRFWFDVRGFDGAWFSARLEEALGTAGPRYTPQIHVDLPIAGEFDAFGRTERFFDCVKACARKVRDKLRTFEYSDQNVAAEASLDAAATSLITKVEAVLAELADVQFQPIGPLPFSQIAGQVAVAEEAAEEVERFLSERERAHDAEASAKTGTTSRASYPSNPFRERRLRLYSLSAELREAREALTHADRTASGALMLLRGDAGTGKTHLLCDVARQRVAANRPTVLLLGQRFVSNDAPWTQALQHLDLAGLSAEEFVGALESAAQAAGSRALVLIDAINEGSGRVIWPNHLAAFLAHLERSLWVGVVLSVRSSYEEIVVPEAVRERAAVVTHNGFMDHEYDATRTFFVHYGLELPSTPLLAPEFRNPFFLKTLCEGLRTKGERRLPRGFHGITAVFDLYLSAINQRLASALGFDPRTPLVRQALEAVSKVLVDSGKRWLTLAKAGEIINSQLPDREFEQSLYRGLVVEGVLVEDAVRRQDADRDEIVFVAYDRFVDHLAARTLLDRHLDAGNPASAFAAGGALAFLADKKQYVPPGLLEAMCIQIPERTGQEIIALAPAISERWEIGDAFRQSLVWRALNAFSDGTCEALNKLSRNDHDLRDTLDVLLTVATFPGHPLNATFLDRRLRKDAMPERDAWWSTYLHAACGGRGAVDRLVDWASSVIPDTTIDDETVDLCAITLAWMLTTSNRFLRDRATKALVSLLTGRMLAVGRLVERFTDVDDPYVVERIYAVAYGTSTRCHDPHEVGALAERVYARMFAAGAPPPHILLRDYARGVVERALYLGSKVQVDASHIRPPYKSQWPTIPTEEDIKPFLPDWSRGSHDSGDLEWSRNCIGSSVLDGDFAHYVIGSSSSSWLSLGLEDPAWKPPERPEDQLRALASEFSDEERNAWKAFNAAEAALQAASYSFLAGWFAQRGMGANGDAELSDVDALKQWLGKSHSQEIAALEAKIGQAHDVLYAALTKQHARRLEEILTAKEAYHDTRRPPRLELRQIQRYILRRVFELGWTTERFGHFDRFSVGYHDREASKAERIGKKYQWIAWHEIMALVADHFQYREELREEGGDQAYDGPWQADFRDIDPSCTIRSLRGGTSWEGHSPSWWGAAPYGNWGSPGDPRGWVVRCDDLPDLADLLIVTNPEDTSRWISAQGYLIWRQQPPADKESTDVELRELWLLCTGYLIRTEDAEPFVKWAEGIDFWGRWMPDPAQVCRMFLGEHGWAPASRYFQQQYFGDAGETQSGHGCPTSMRTVAFKYLREASGVDRSVDESYTLRLPAAELVAGMALRWVGNGADFVNTEGRLAAFDPTVHAAGPSVLLLREELLQEFLAREKLTVCWTVLGEKRVLAPGFSPGHRYPALRMSGAYVLADKGLVGFLKCTLDDPDTKETSSPPRVLAFIRSPV
ncbi:MAG: AVAST type 2 anti-phage system protein Avs2 [Candidatus Eisenbacteria bacterium]